MKFKELPPFLVHTFKLKAAPQEKLAVRVEDQIPVIVSLTTIPSRLSSLHLTIRSLLLQDAQPEKILLWLHKDLKSSIPRQLTQLVGDIFEIRYSAHTFSHRKLIHTLDAHPDKILVTSDDDLIYPPDTLGNLYQSHLKSPNNVIGHRCREVTYENNSALPYLEWPFTRVPLKCKELLMPIGAFLILYPPNILDARATDIDLFMSLSPRSDDVWFKVMTLLAGHLSIPSSHLAPEPIPIWNTQRVALKKTNNSGHKVEQWNTVIDHFKDELLEKHPILKLTGICFFPGKDLQGTGY